MRQMFQPRYLNNQRIFNMFFWINFLTAADASPACELSSGNSLTLTKFYSDNCEHCTQITPHVNEIMDKIIGSNLNMKVKSVNCKDCDCSALNIVAVPTLILSKGKEEISRLRGFAEYEGIVQFLTDHLEIDKEIFKNSQNEDGKVKQLYERDFYSGFKGPWLILFYGRRKDPIREIFEDVAIQHHGKLNVGEISQSNSINLVHRFNIQAYPAVIAIYNGILAGYNGKQDKESVNEFVDRLISPSFTELTLNKFEQLATEDTKTPKFVVFYSNLGLANGFFRKAAHDYKLRAKIYKSNDTNLFQRASIYPKKIDDEQATDEDKIILTVFKDNVFHRCPLPLSNPQAIAEWLFHSHFPNVTRITNDNFYTVFHGLKPAVLLLTEGEEFVDLLEAAAQRLNDGLPFNEQIIATLDITEFAMFMPSLLPGLKTPAMIVYNPQRQLFFTNRVRFNRQDFYNDLLFLINKYFENRLNPYPYRSKWKKYLFGGLFFGVAAICYTLMKKQKTFIKKE